MRGFLWSSLLFLLACTGAPAAPACFSGKSLASYEALGAEGCNVGSLTVKDFVFSVVSSGGGAIPVSDNDITVTTQFLANGFGLRFASAGFNVTGAGFVNYLIAYTWDPTADIRGAGDLLDPGASDIVTDGCVGVAFRESTCIGSPFSLHVFQGATSQLTDSVTFPATAILGLRNLISLNANGGSAGFDSLENDVVVPEPASLFFVAAGLAALASRQRGRMRKTLHLTLQHSSELRRRATGGYRG